MCLHVFIVLACVCMFLLCLHVFIVLACFYCVCMFFLWSLIFQHEFSVLSFLNSNVQYDEIRHVASTLLSSPVFGHVI